MKNYELLTPIKNQITREYNYPAIEHGHTDWEITLFTEGNSINQINGIIYPAPPNRIFVLGPMHRHSVTFNGKIHNHRDIYIDKHRMEFIMNTLFGESLYKAICSEKPPYLDISQDMSKQILAQLKNVDAFSQLEDSYQNARALADSIIVFILGLFLQDNMLTVHPLPEWFLNFMKKIRNPEIFHMRISDIVKTTGYSHTQLSFLFKKYTQHTLVNYILKLRMEHGAHLLQNTNDDILTIAGAVGYDSVSFFIKLFTKYYGVTPLKYRKSYLKPIQH